MSISNIQSMISAKTTIATATTGTRGEPGQVYVGLDSAAPNLPKFVTISDYSIRDMGVLMSNIDDSELPLNWDIYDTRKTLFASQLVSGGIFASEDEALSFFALAAEVWAFYPEAGQFGTPFTLDLFNRGTSNETVGLRYLNGVYQLPNRPRKNSPFGKAKKDK